MRSTTLNEKRESLGDGINPILAQLDLVRRNEAPIDPRHYRAQIEECQLPERIGKIVADLNRAAGYHLLEMVYFLPPQKTVLRVSFSKDETDYEMEIVLDEHSAAVVFYSLKGISKGWARYFSISTRRRNRTTFFDLDFQAAEIQEENLNNWFSYLLSGLEKKFRPGPKPQPLENSGIRGDIIFGKASA
jgi:hypothetical protein